MTTSVTTSGDAGWTLLTLKEYVDTRLRSAEERVDIAFASSEKAIEKAETAHEKRLDSVNEFRGQLADQTATLMPRIEAETRINQLAELMTLLDNRLTADIAGIHARLNITDGQRLGSKDTTTSLYAFIGAIATLIVVAIAVVGFIVGTK